MNHREFDAERLKEIETRWFANHRAVIVCGDAANFTHLCWQQPGTNNYRVDYVLLPKLGVLHVSGDIGCATYEWNGRISLTFLAGCNADYFIGKAQGLQGFLSYDGRTEFISSHAAEWIKAEMEDTDLPEDFKTDILDHLESQQDLDRFLWDEYSEAIDADAETLSALSRAPRATDMRAMAHWKGIVMAHAQLSKPA